MDVSSLPDWVQIVVMLSIAISAAFVGVYKYLKTETRSDIPDSSLISASLIDSKLLRELIECIREFHEEQSRDLKKSHRLSQDLREGINELNILFKLKI